MAKNTDDKDEQGADKQEREPPASVRDAIKAAVEEHSQDEDDSLRDSDKDGQDTETIDKSSKEENTEDREDTAEDDKSKAVRKPKEKEEKQLELEVKETTEPKVVVPTTLPKEIQKDWAKLPSNVQQYITKSQKEFSDAKAELGRKTSQYREMDAAIAPYHASIQKLGVTPAQTVDRLFQWMNALAGPQKYYAIQQLAQDFNIDLPALYQQAVQQQDQQYQDDPNNPQQQQQAQPQTVDPRIATALESIYGEVTQLKETHQRQRENAAAQTVNSWAGLQQDGSFKHKPYFPVVRQRMFNLLSSGEIPLIDGQLDLDRAYEEACYSNSEVRQLVLAQEQEKKAAELEAKKQKKAAEDRAKVSKARSLGVSLKPSAPSGDITSNLKKSNSKGGGTSVRDSIMSAVSELNN